MKGAINRVVCPPKPMKDLLSKIEEKCCEFSVNNNRAPAAVVVNANDYNNFTKINYYPYLANTGEPIALGEIRVFRSLDLKPGEIFVY